MERRVYATGGDSAPYCKWAGKIVRHDLNPAVAFPFFLIHFPLLLHRDERETKTKKREKNGPISLFWCSIPIETQLA